MIDIVAFHDISLCWCAKPVILSISVAYSPINAVTLSSGHTNGEPRWLRNKDKTVVARWLAKDPGPLGLECCVQLKNTHGCTTGDAVRCREL